MFIDFRERGAGAEREKLQSVASCTCPTGDQTRNLGICPDWETNLLQPIESPSQDSQPGI